jgi:hypothetical protein
MNFLKEIKRISINYNNLTVPQLKELCKKKNIKGYSKKTKKELIELLK